MSAPDLDVLAALERAATPGPWAIENRVILVAEECFGGDAVNVILGHVNQPGIAENERNAALIVAMRNALPDLIAAARRRSEVS